MKPAPIPCSLCGVCVPPLMTGLFAGSTANTCSVGQRCLSTSPHAVMCPPVPTPVISHVEPLGEVAQDLLRRGAHVHLDVRRVLELHAASTPSPRRRARRSHELLRARDRPFIPTSRGVSSSSRRRPPSRAAARPTSTRACTRISRYPFTAATIASPIPVLPDVGSTITCARGDAARALGVLDHRQRDAVLDRAARVLRARASSRPRGREEASG
jgi:hypothetical protein